MYYIEKEIKKEISGEPIGGWLWLLMVIIIASGLQMVISVIMTTTEFLEDNWKRYFQPTDNLLKLRIHIYFYLISSMIIGIGILVWSLFSFFKCKRKFPAIFLGLLGYLILTEVIRIYILIYYAGLTDQDASNMDSGLFKTGIIAIIAGLYLNKGKRPNRTFVN